MTLLYTETLTAEELEEMSGEEFKELDGLEPHGFPDGSTVDEATS